jgi:hypothetical protein
MWENNGNYINRCMGSVQQRIYNDNKLKIEYL